MFCRIPKTTLTIFFSIGLTQKNKMNDLPVEILCLIFDFLPTRSDRNKYRLVCVDWANIIANWKLSDEFLAVQDQIMEFVNFLANQTKIIKIWCKDNSISFILILKNTFAMFNQPHIAFTEEIFINPSGFIYDFGEIIGHISEPNIKRLYDASLNMFVYTKSPENKILYKTLKSKNPLLFKKNQSDLKHLNNQFPINLKLQLNPLIEFI